MFTRQHYKAIAESIDSTKLTREDFVNPYKERDQGVADGINVTRQEIAEKLADYFANDNPNFNCKKFLDACSTNT